jgi:hypothetical protein
MEPKHQGRREITSKDISEYYILLPEYIKDLSGSSTRLISALMRGGRRRSTPLQTKSRSLKPFPFGAKTVILLMLKTLENGNLNYGGVMSIIVRAANVPDLELGK